MEVKEERMQLKIQVSEMEQIVEELETKYADKAEETASLHE